MEFFNLFSQSRELRQALEQSRARLYRMAYAWCHNAALADDLVQEALTKALRKSGQLRDPKARDAWLFSILANCYRDHFRRHRDMDDVDDFELSDEATPESHSSRQEIVVKVRAAITKLSEGQRQVVTMVDLEGFSYVEVSQILEVPIGTVMSRLCRARNALRELLVPEMERQTGSQGVTLRRVK
jgi:RNA polymerase sigma-70 factor (ECF subfamily)